MTEAELEIKKEPQIKVKPKRARVLLDFDGVFKAKKRIGNQINLDTSQINYEDYCSLLEKNKGLDVYFKNQNLNQSNSELGFGSSRCCKLLDLFNMKDRFQNREPHSSAFHTIPSFANKLKWPIHLLTVEDVIENQKPGTAVREAVSEQGKEEYRDRITSKNDLPFPEDDILFIYNDLTKILLIYANAQEQALIDQDYERELHLVDDHQGILNNLARFFSKFPHLIPKGTTLKLTNYHPESRKNIAEKHIPQLIHEIKGTGEVNANYRDTLLAMGKKLDRINRYIKLFDLIHDDNAISYVTSLLELDDQALAQPDIWQKIGITPQHLQPGIKFKHLKELGLLSLSDQHKQDLIPLIENPREKSVFALFSAGLISIISLGSPFLWPAVATAFGIPALFSAYYREKLSSKTKKVLLGLGAILVTANTAFVMLATFGVGPFDFLGGASVFDILPGYIGLFTGIILPLAMMTCMLFMIYQEYQNVKTNIAEDHPENSKAVQQDQNSSLHSHTSKHSVSNSIHNSDQSKSELTSDAETETVRPQETKNDPSTVTQKPIYTAKPSSRAGNPQYRSHKGSKGTRSYSGHPKNQPRTAKPGLAGHGGLLQALQATASEQPTSSTPSLPQPIVGVPQNFTLLNGLHRDTTHISAERTSGTPSPISSGTLHEVIIDGSTSPNLTFGAGQTSQ